MYLRSLDYSQWDDNPRAWSLEGCTLGDINLIVGKNSTGKTRILNVINSLGHLLAGEQKPFASANYKAVDLEDGKSRIQFSLNCLGGKVAKETLKIGNTTFLNRGAEGKGQIYYEKENKKLEFQAPENEVASFARRDSLQHAFLNNLYLWGKSVRHYAFGKSMGQDGLMVTTGSEDNGRVAEIDLKQSNQVVLIVRKAIEEYGEKFKRRVIKQMKEVGYELNSLDINQMRDVTITSGIVGLPAPHFLGISVQEKSLQSRTDQHELSQGMFRTLSLLAQIAYSELKGQRICFLIDDIGEGLDYQRSVALIRLVTESVKKDGNQLVMTTNDRFVMNSVPLEHWSIVHREGNVSRMFNYRNAKDMFDEFSVTGLSNFDLFSSQFFLKDLPKN